MPGFQELIDLIMNYGAPPVLIAWVYYLHSNIKELRQDLKESLKEHKDDLRKHSDELKTLIQNMTR